MVSARALHKLAEEIYEALDREGYWDEDGGGRSGSRTRRSRRGNRSIRLPPRRRQSSGRRKRRVSAYQKEFGRQLKKLKKKHPRTNMRTLMKRAHAATKRARRGR